MRSIPSAFILAMFACAALGAQPLKSKLLYSFEPGEDISQFTVQDARLQQAQDRATDGRYSLVVSFRRVERPQVTFPAGPADWRPFGALAVDVFNPFEEPATLRIEVRDATGAATGGEVRVRARKTMSVALALNAPNPLDLGMRGQPAIPGFRLCSSDHRRVDLRRVATFSLSLVKPEKSHTLYADNVRLTGGPSYDRIVDRFGQFALDDWPGKLKSEAELAERRAAEEAELKKSPTLADRDAYGGWASGPQLKATGFFRAEKHAHKWWLVTPAGRLFLSFGVNSVNTTEGDTVTEGREGMFQWLPGKDDPLASHFRTNRDWEALGLKIKFHLGRSFNFYSANLQRKYGKSWFEEWSRTALARLPAWGFNTIGNWSEPKLYARKVPYTVTVDPWPAATADPKEHFAVLSSGDDYWRMMTDPYDPKFAAVLERSVAETAARFRDDPFCLGYFVDNELSWGSMRSERSRYGLALGALALTGRSPAKRTFVDQLKAKYADVGKLNEAWGVKVPSWEALLGRPFQAPGDFSQPMKEDFGAFVKDLARRYFRTVRETLKKHDPNHLYLGTRFAWYTMESVEACGEICDVVSFNIYRPRVERDQWKFVLALDKPVIVGEFHMGALDRGMFHPGLVAAEDQEDRARMYQEYVRSVVDHPSFVGCHWFKYADEPLTGRPGDGENYSIGLVDVTDTPYPEFIAAAKAVHEEAYRRRAR